jgi:peptide/nickel transport system substrate-binding protein
MKTSHPTSRSITATLTATAVLTGVLAGPGSWPSYAGAASLTAASSATSSVTIDTSSPPNSLDPQEGYTTSAGEADWIVYTPLLTYAHKSGLAGTQIIPGLATSLPKITDGGTTYTLTLRPGLKYSDGTPVMASDVKFAIERALRLNWGASSFLQPIVGAAAYQAGKSSDLSGVSADDATRTIVVHLTSSIGDFSNVLCFPALSPVPQDTPMKVQTTKLPPGVGAYILTNVVPNVSYELVKNPLFASFHIPGIPLGHIDQIHIDIVSNPTTETEAILDNQIDAMDITDTVPPALIARVESEAANRFQKEVVASTNYFFLNQRLAPFNNPLAREAAAYAIDRDALARLGGGFITPTCYFIPVGIAGHPTAPCPYPSPNVAKGKQLLSEAHLVGAPVSVFGFSGPPQSSEAQYYASALQSVGFKVNLKLINPAIYWTTIGNVKTAADTGEAGQFLDFPNPADFLMLIDARNIHPVNSDNFGNVDVPHIQSTLERLEAVPAAQLMSVAGQWAALDEYATRQVDYIVWGSNELIKFFSTRINFASAVFQPLFFNDYSTWQLNS